MHSAVFLTQCFVTAALAGLCWAVQLAVYALFGRLLNAGGAEVFRVYHAGYTRAMGGVAAPLMLAEITLALVWFFAGEGTVQASIGLGLVVAIWLLTFGLIVPIHQKLQDSPTESAAARLVRLNWLRTALWTARSVFLAVVAYDG